MACVNAADCSTLPTSWKRSVTSLRSSGSGARRMGLRMDWRRVSRGQGCWPSRRWPRRTTGRSPRGRCLGISNCPSKMAVSSVLWITKSRCCNQAVGNAFGMTITRSRVCRPLDKLDVSALSWPDNCCLAWLSSGLAASSSISSLSNRLKPAPVSPAFENMGKVIADESLDLRPSFHTCRLHPAGLTRSFEG